jgi:hypothetical protein
MFVMTSKWMEVILAPVGAGVDRAHVRLAELVAALVPAPV